MQGDTARVRNRSHDAYRRYRTPVKEWSATIALARAGATASVIPAIVGDALSQASGHTDRP
jgi:hypothetical protein